MVGLKGELKRASAAGRAAPWTHEADASDLAARDPDGEHAEIQCANCGGHLGQCLSVKDSCRRTSIVSGRFGDAVVSNGNRSVFGDRCRRRLGHLRLVCVGPYDCQPGQHGNAWAVVTGIGVRLAICVPYFIGGYQGVP